MEKQYTATTRRVPLVDGEVAFRASIVYRVNSAEVIFLSKRNFPTESEAYEVAENIIKDIRAKIPHTWYRF